MTEPAPIVIIGAGHNGLVCAAYLARAGRKVLVLEAREVPGGAAATREFHPGFRVSTGAHLLHLFSPVISRELDLARHGLVFAHTELPSAALSTSAPALVVERGHAAAGDLSNADRAALSGFHGLLTRLAGVLRRQHDRPPPRLRSEAWAERVALAKLGFDVRRLGRADMRELLRLATMNVYDAVGDRFQSAQLRGLFAFDAVLGTNRGPRSGNTMLNLLHRMSGPDPGVYALPRGGVGCLSHALAAAARASGAVIRTNAAVGSVLLDQGVARGVRLANGEEIRASLVVSNADPKATLLNLVGTRHLETEFATRVRRIRAQGNAAKLHLALSGKPQFLGLADGHVGGRLVIAPDPDYIERAFNPSKYGEYSLQPILELTVPTIHDPDLAPAGQHVVSAIVQYAPYTVTGGWDAHRNRFQAEILAVLEAHAPGLSARVVGAELLTPLDLEREFGLPAGHWHHAEYTLDQMLMLRPVPDAARYRTPIEGLYLCGAGCHPGGGIMGHTGRNAARAVLRAQG